ncbi:MAG TPA: DUF459 domain-containing protein [Pseudolabrys sp.]|nr:DUF459 domain-containing protein [Pseudolabrys sp.]
MIGKFRISRWMIGALVLVAAECAGVVAFQVALTGPAQAQRLDDRYPFLSRQRPRSSGGFFHNLFGNDNERSQRQEPQVDHSRAPSPRKPDPKAPPVVPTISIVVMGDGMAGWLAYGLEDAFADEPEIGIVRKDKVHSGLLRYDSKTQLDWWNVARDELAKEKPNYVIMMLGVSDRQNIREKDIAKEAETAKAGDKAGDKAKPDAQGKDQDKPDPSSIVAPEPEAGKKANGIIEFRSDRWATVYSRRIDETLAALKSKGVPVFWVGLPSIRGTKSTADAVYLNDLYRSRAERAGAIYVDIWDGFVDEAGKFATYGPDYEGQMRSLRSSDGVYFTKAGARKLAHFVERELRRYMNNHVTPVALPVGPVGPATAPGKSAARPLAGPVVPLTVAPTNSDELLGGAGVHPAHDDAIADRVLVKGEPIAPPPGRADDYTWPPGSDRKAALPAAVPAETPAIAPESKPAERRPAEHKTGAAAKSAAKLAAENAKLAQEKKTARQPSHNHRPPPIRQDPMGWFR